MKSLKSLWTVLRSPSTASAPSCRLSQYDVPRCSTTSCTCCPPAPPVHKLESSLPYKTLPPHPHHRHPLPLLLQRLITIKGPYILVCVSGPLASVPHAAKTPICCASVSDALAPDCLLLFSHTLKHLSLPLLLQVSPPLPTHQYRQTPSIFWSVSSTSPQPSTTMDF